MRITKAHVQYAGMTGWVMTVDSDRQRLPNLMSQIDTTLQNLAFLHCKFCFSITHTLAECEQAPDQESNLSGTQSLQQASTQSVFSYLVSPWQHRVCLLYNCESTPGCSFSNCKFGHICSLCTDDPHAIDKRHKAMMCLYHPIPSSNSKPPKKNGIHPGCTTDLTPSTNKYPKLYKQSR